MALGLVLLFPGGWATGQSVLERTPNLTGAWTASPGVIQFNLLHRFDVSPAPARKVTNSPTLLVGYGVHDRVIGGGEPGGGPTRPGRAGAFLTGFGLVAAGCFSEHADTPTGVVPDVECSVPPPQPAANEVIVAIRDFAFHPSTITVQAGTEVTWINCEETGIAAHTSTADGGAWDSGLLDPGGQTFSRSFDAVGTFAYHCTPHPFMQGTVTMAEP